MNMTSLSRLSRRQLALALMSLCLPLLACSQSASGADVVTLDTARAELEAGRAVLIDIREPDEHNTGVAKGAHLLPMRQLNARLAEIPTASDKPVFLICNTQNRSSATLRALRV